MKCQGNRITNSIIRQFEKPSGMMGWLAGQIMARRKSNIDRNLWTVSLLAPKPDDTILEIGPGPGVALHAIAEKLIQGKVIGLDHSMMMLKLATKRNHSFIQHQRVELIQGSASFVSNLPYQFDKIFTVNCLMFWDNAESILHKIYSKLKVGGLIAITHQPRNKEANHQDVIETGNRIRSLLHKTNFTNITVHINPMKPVSAVCVTAGR